MGFANNIKPDFLSENKQVTLEECMQCAVVKILNMALKDKILNCLPQIAEEVVNFDNVVIRLLSLKLLTVNERELLVSYVTTYSKVTELFLLVIKKDLDENSENLRQALEQSGNSHVAKILFQENNKIENGEHISQFKSISEKELLPSSYENVMLWCAKIIKEMFMRLFRVHQFLGGRVIQLQNTSATVNYCVNERRGSLFSLPPALSNFTGRRTELLQIKTALHDTNSGLIERTVVINGLGGMGKSELAKEYANENYDLYDGNVIWIRSENFSTISESVYSVAKYLLKDVSPTDDLKNMMKMIYLHFSNSKVLIIFDNCEIYFDETNPHYRGLHDLLPRAFGFPRSKAFQFPFIIITTSRSNFFNRAFNLPLCNFNDTDAHLMLEENLKADQTNEEVACLCKTLQNFPLALAQAICYINRQHKKNGYSVTDYIKDLDSEKCKNILEYKIATGNINSEYEILNTTFGILQLPLKNIEAQCNIALEILACVAFLSPDNIPTNILQKFYFPNVEKNDFEDAIETIAAYSIFSIDGGLISIHRLMQYVIRITLNENQSYDNTIRKILTDTKTLVSQSIPESFVAHAISIWNYATQSNDLVSEYKQVPVEISKYLSDNFRKESHEFAEQALDCLKMALGSYAIEVLTLAYQYVSSSDSQANYQKSQAAIEEWVPVVEKALGPQSPLALKFGYQYGLLLNRRGKWEEALRQYKKVVKRQEKILGESHCDTLFTVNNMALIYEAQGKYKKGLKTYKKLLSNWEKVGDEPYILLTKHNMAAVYIKLAEYDLATAIYNDVYLRRKQLFGPEHPKTLSTQHNLGAVYKESGKLENAVEQYEDVLAKRVKIHGHDHFYTLATKQDLAVVQGYLLNTAQALNMCDEVYNSKVNVHKFDCNHPSLVHTQHCRGLIYYACGDFQNALDNFREAYCRRRYKLTDDNLETLTSKRAYADALLAKSQEQDALVYYKEVYVALEKALTNEHPRVIVLKHDIQHLEEKMALKSVNLN